MELVLNPPTPSTPGSSGSGIAWSDVERTQAGQIEDRAEVDEERVVALAGEDLGAVAERLRTADVARAS